MKNKAQTTNREKRTDNQENTPIFPKNEGIHEEFNSLAHDMLNRMLKLLDRRLKKIEQDPDNIEKEKQLSQCLEDYGKLVRAKDVLMKRENITRQGYDTNARISEWEYKAKQEAELEEVNETQSDPTTNEQSEQSEQPETEQSEQAEEPENPESEQLEEAEEEALGLTNLHPDMAEYEACLPKDSDQADADENAQDQDGENAKNVQDSAKGFRPYGKMCDFFKSHGRVKISGGTYDAGKTYSCVAYMDMLARNYPNARLTFIHRSLKRVYSNIIPTYEKYLGYRPSSSSDLNPTPITRYGGEQPVFFEYWNGSRIYINGLDKPQNLLSDFFDAAFVNQAELLDFDAWDELTARVSERAGTLPVAFLIGDCNPSVPNHWIRQQTKAGKLEYFEMTFRDNPEIYDQETGDLLEKGKPRVERLESLEGLRYKRGYEGKWEAGEGLVFPMFMPDIHIIDNFDIPEDWKRYLSIDWGFRSPASCIWWAVGPGDKLYAYKEIYKTKMTHPDFIKMIKDHCGPDDHIRRTAVDNADPEAITQLRRAGLQPFEPKKSRAMQLDAIRARLKVDATGEPGIFFFRDRLVHPPDPDLSALYCPVEVTDEFLSCTYDEKIRGTGKDDEAIKGANHGIDSTAYFLMTLKQVQTVGSGRVVHAPIQLGKTTLF